MKALGFGTEKSSLSCKKAAPYPIDSGKPKLNEGYNNISHVVELNPLHKLRIAARLSRTSGESTI